MHTFILLSIQECASRRVAKAQKGIVFPSPPLIKESKGHCWPILLARSNYQSSEKVASLLPVAEDAENFRCGGGLLDYVQILYGNKGSQQKYGLEVPQMKKNT